MTLDDAALRHCGGELRKATLLCRAGIGAVRTALAEARPITIGCTQEAPVFEELADAASMRIDFANIREAAGWSDATGTGPKMAALLAAAAVPAPPPAQVTLTSEGVTLIYGRDSAALDLAARLADTLDVTVLLDRPGAVTPPAIGTFPVYRGTIVRARGHLGAFELTVDDFAEASPASRDHLVWAAPRNGAVSRCDVVIDITAGTALFPAGDLRPGHVRADPAAPGALDRAQREAADLVGTFDKPAHIAFTPSLCAHSRSKRTGCTRCLDLCPTGAITPAGDAVAIDPAICAGCGACASVCPTGAAAYAVPPPSAVIAKLRVLLGTYRAAGGQGAVLLLHDSDHGLPLIEAAARHGRGLPAHVLPLHLNEVTQTDLAILAAAYAYGAARTVLLQRARPRHDNAGLHRLAALAAAILAPLGLEPPSILETDDPDALWTLPSGPTVATPSRFVPMAEGRALTVTALRELHRAAGAEAPRIALPQGSPFGAVAVNTQGCTLCLACVSACPTHALRDDPDRPALRFAEADCVQCGLCRATCPENVITLAPRLDLAAWAGGAVTLKQEEPYPCLKCGTPFGTRASIDRIVAKLEGQHWMFSGANAKRIDLLRMCETCRVEVTMNEGFDPHAAPPRPPPRT